MIEYNKNENKNKIVVLSGSDKLNRKKRRIGALALSTAAMTAVCISITAAAGAPKESAAPADLSEYKYTSEESLPTAESEQSAQSEAAGRAAVEVPAVTLPDAVPNVYSTTYSAAVNARTALEASPSAYDVIIKADGERYDVTVGGTVEDAIDKSGIEIGKHDIITPDLDTPLSDSTIITIQRVQYLKIITSKAIPSDTEYIDDETLPIGETAVITEGCDGKLEKTYYVKRVDGEDVKSKLLSEEITAEPVNTVIANGTCEDEPEYYDDNTGDIYEENSYDEYSDDYGIEAQSFDYYDNYETYSGDGIPAAQVAAVSQFDVPTALLLDENNIPLNYTKALYGKSCAYTAEEGALMSTGKAVEQGYVAVNPEIIPYGTKMYIVADDGEVYGYAIAADTGGSVGRNDILVDLFMWSYDECIQWGAKNVTIYILDEE